MQPFGESGAAALNEKTTDGTPDGAVRGPDLDLSMDSENFTTKSATKPAPAPAHPNEDSTEFED